MKASVLIGVLGLLAFDATAQERSTAIAAESSSLLRNPRIFVAHHDAATWAGDVVAHRASASDATPLWSAARMLDARSDAEVAALRLVLSSDPLQTGIALQWATLPASMQASLAVHGLGERQLAYLRGDRSLDAAPDLRMRASRLGDVLNANLWFVGRGAGANPSRVAMVYAGANDGMLHGFDAEDGSEKIAYVPAGLLPHLAASIQKNAAHQYLADGPLFSGEAPLGQDGAARTFLVGALGAGGKGFYVLDISEPSQFSAADASRIVTLDSTATADPDIGQIYAPPVVDDVDPNRARQIVRLNNRRWAVVQGNGYFSQSGRPVLLVQYLDGARELFKLAPCTDGQACAYAGDNGLSTPRLVDVNGDGMVDLAYAGDLLGHLWKFDLSGDQAEVGAQGAWHVAFAGQPFFVARDASGKRQPITTAPYWMPHPRGGLMLAFGTGRHLRSSDTANRDTQSIYGLHDDSAMAVSEGKVRIDAGTPIHSAETATARPATLIQQQYGPGIRDGDSVYHQVVAAPASSAADGPQRGWWIDLPYAGQRVLDNPRGFEGQKMLVHSVVPAAAPTGAIPVPWNAGASYLSALNMLTGQAPAQPAFSPADAMLPREGWGMASTAGGPALLFRQAGSTQLRFPGAQPLVLRTSKTQGARTGWRERP